MKRGLVELTSYNIFSRQTDCYIIFTTTEKKRSLLKYLITRLIYLIFPLRAAKYQLKFDSLHYMHYTL